ncbi:MAG TPA: ATP-binding protein, partial [Verrucomicrobiae bacterium]|nr:ATP-binding protein [Verrucomicrobiae bacterium]
PFRPCLQGEMVYVPDGNRLDLAMSQKLAGAGFASCVAVPLVTKDKVFGLLVLSRRQANGYSDAEQDFIRGLSAHVALAVQQAQLYQDLRTAYVELHQTQQTVMQQERLKALGQMASGIAHDINNALSPVVGFAELINQTESALSEDSKKYLEYIKTAGQDVAQIVARLREFYRPRDPKESLQLLDLNRVAAQALDMTRPRWRDIPQGRGIMIEARTDFDPHLAKFCGIESESREAITNLIINAVDALPHGGTLEIRTRMQKSGAEEVILEVRDTGIGMDEQTRKRCLEPFFSTKGQRGTGLGLATVYGVMERHKGRIEIESEPGKGTVMRLIFPVRRLVKTDPVNPAENVPPGPFWILCIDDEPGVRKLLHKMLELDHHQVQMTDGGEAGLEAFRAANGQGRPFDVVITDLGMPYLDGREVAKILKRESPGTPIIMLTGWGVFMKEDGRTLSQVEAF